MPTLDIDNQAVAVAPGATLLEAALRAGVQIPTLCWRDGLEHVTSCMLCVVEDCADGTLRPACSTPAEQGMRIATASPAVIEARRMALDLLLSDHVGDCEGPCRRACPAGMDIPAMLRAVAADDFGEAIRIVKEAIALPAVLGRVCPAPCEKACRRGFRDEPVSICCLKRHVADLDLAADHPYTPVLPAPSGFRIAVVGAGPAGLAAAWHLKLAGHQCTLFEKTRHAGGGFRADALRAILPLDLLDAEIDRILALGVDLRTGVDIGRDIDIKELKHDFHAVVLALGNVSRDDPAVAARNLEQGRHGIKVEGRRFRTSDPGVYAVGNAVSPGRLGVRSVAHGRAAAASISRRLASQPVDGAARPYSHHLTGAPNAEEMAEFMAGAATAARCTPHGDAAANWTVTEARTQAARCLHCDCRKADACRLRHYAGEYQAHQRDCRPAVRRQVRMLRSDTVVYEPGKCIGCGICVRLTALAKEPLGLTFTGRGFDVRVAVPFNESLENGLGRVAAECIRACPTGALAWAGD